MFAQEQSRSLVVEDHNKATALNYLKPEGVSKLWNNDSACPAGQYLSSPGSPLSGGPGVGGETTATPLEEATQEPMAVAKVASSRGISAS